MSIMLLLVVVIIYQSSVISHGADISDLQHHADTLSKEISSLDWSVASP